MTKNILDLIGNTPLIEIETEKKVSVYAKLEFFNPAGSIKDRVAKSIIEDGLASGVMTKKTCIIEPTSGNTGIGLAMVGAVLGMKVVIVMPDSMTKERIDLIKAYGAEIILTEGKLGMTGAVNKANELAKVTENAVIAGQFYNKANVNAHYKTTGPEIWEQMNNDVDIFVSAFGTGGTVSGVGKFLKEKNEKVKIIAVEPESSPLVSRGYFAPHKIQGIGANFIPENYLNEFVDEIMTANYEEAMNACDFLAEKRGIFVGISSGANFAIAEKIALQTGKKVVTVFPDSGLKYLSIK